MVYCGKPSRGCENCRKLHKKCDEKLPQCSRCLRMGRKCSGYRKPSNLMFRDESLRTQEKVQRHQSRATSSYPKSSTNAVWRGPQAAPWGYTISPAPEDLAVCHFYNTTMANLSAEDPARRLHAELPGLYAQSHPGSVLRLATEAISYASSTKQVSGAVQLSRKRYMQATRAARTALQDIEQGGEHQTLYAILLLCGYETMMWASNSPPAWGTHIDGAAALVKLRGFGNSRSSLSRGLFSFVRRSVVLSHMQLSQPLDTIFTTPYEATYPSYESPEDELTIKAAKIPGLQHLSNIYFTQPGVTRENFEELIHHATLLDLELSCWASNASINWAYSAASNANVFAGSEFAPRQVHRYPDYYTARVWNSYRVSRLIVQSLLLRALPYVSDETSRTGQKKAEIEISSMGLVDDICASVPFLLGHDLSKMTLPTANQCGVLESPHQSRSPRAGRFSLLWPLFVASSAPTIPETQREWMRTQLELITEQGEPQARCLCLAESQVLLGGTETFRFDCV